MIMVAFSIEFFLFFLSMRLIRMDRRISFSSLSKHDMHHLQLHTTQLNTHIFNSIFQIIFLYLPLPFVLRLFFIFFLFCSGGFNQNRYQGNRVNPRDCGSMAYSLSLLYIIFSFDIAITHTTNKWVNTWMCGASNWESNAFDFHFISMQTNQKKFIKTFSCRRDGTRWKYCMNEPDNRKRCSM